MPELFGSIPVGILGAHVSCAFISVHAFLNALVRLYICVRLVSTFSKSFSCRQKESSAICDYGACIRLRKTHDCLGLVAAASLLCYLSLPFG